MVKHAFLLTGLMAASTLFAQTPARGTAEARVRIVSQATWQRMQGGTKGIDALGQVRLQGVVEQVDGATVRLRMAFGTVRVELGDAIRAEALRAGEALTVVADKIMAGGAQRLLATEVQPLG